MEASTIVKGCDYFVRRSISLNRFKFINSSIKCITKSCFFKKIKKSFFFFKKKINNKFYYF